MTALRSFMASLGVALAAVGVLFVVVPEAATSLPLPRLGVLVLGVFALVEGARSLQTRRRTGLNAAEPPEPERRAETDRPGDDFDARVAAVERGTWRRTMVERERLERRLRSAAVEAVADRWRLTTEAARERVAAGEWTDDPAAAWYLGGTDVPRPPWRMRLGAFVGRRSAVDLYTARTVDAIVALREAR